MAERYTRLFTCPADLYAEGSPVIIAAGALLKDSVTGALIAQLKFRSISEKKIKALTAELALKDSAGRDVGGTVEHQYLDLTAKRDETFGQKVPVILNDSGVRAYSAKVTEVIFEDCSVWTAPEGCAWESLPKQSPLYPNDAEMKKQYRLEVCSAAEREPLDVKDLWFCACGTLNGNGEEKCRKCGTAHEKLNAVDRTALAESCAKRVEAEQEAARRKKEADRKKRKKAITITAVFAVIIAAVLVFTQKIYPDVIVPNNQYRAAAALMENGQYEEAITAFEAMDGYKDSAEQIEACQTAIKDGEYDAAVTLMENGKYDDAIAAFEAMDGYKDSAEQIKACETAIKDGEYDSAVALMENGDYIGAYKAFGNLNGYKDSAELQKTIETAYLTSVFDSVNIGDTICFGTYEQDNDVSDGAEDIEWIVLDKDGLSVLVISKYALDCQKYNGNNTSMTWENCTLRQWLNDSFLNAAFSSEELNKIEITTVTADENPKYKTDAGKNTEDRIFLLSTFEAEQYFASDDDRACEPTAYAIAQKASVESNYSENGEITCLWWLRTPAVSSGSATYINRGGLVVYDGKRVNSSGNCVRPAMWIDLTA